MFRATLLGLALAGASAGTAQTAGDGALAQIEAMDRAAAQVRDYTMTLVKQERLLGRLEAPQTFLIKFARPQSTYVKNIQGDTPGQEAIYVPGWNRDRLRAHKGSFPDFNLNLDPLGSLAMSRSHHPITEGSLLHLVELISSNVREGLRRGEGSLRRVGTETLWGRPVVKLEGDSPPVFESDTVRPGETLWDVARRTGRGMYLLLHSNLDRGWRRAGDARVGEPVRVPRYYAGRLVLWLDAESHLPLRAEIYDHKAQLYELYEHRELRVNVGLGPEEFDPGNKAYRF
ncbi:MAG TPA: DUF1571 domain-containing protein [Candidatus Polarisedimenticolaceae bacterium]|nr:DUF1571 domain-containing protein [Candidatus Polarisedimenticolaceae bacterium]